MTDYVLEQEIKGLQPPNIAIQLNNKARRFTNCLKYAKFLKKPLKLWMFIPCDYDGNILEEPTKYSNWTNFDYSGTDIGFEDEKLCREYQKAKERCFFEDFKIKEFEEPYSAMSKSVCIADVFHPFWFQKDTQSWHLSKHVSVIDDLAKYELFITETAINQITK
jgi:hypothetical protein